MPIEHLTALNIEIGEKESQIEDQYFEGLLAPEFVMYRANDTRDIVNRTAWVQALQKAPKKPRETQVTSVSLLGQERAIVTCVVTMDGRRYDNLRVFVKNRNPESASQRPWLLLAWVNEPLTT